MAGFTQSLLATGRLLRTGLHVLHGMLVMTRFGSMSPAQRHERIGWWSAGLVRAMGLQLQVVGVDRKSVV